MVRKSQPFTDCSKRVVTCFVLIYSKACLKHAATQKENQKLFFTTDCHLMQVKSFAECSKRAFCNTTFIELPFALFLCPIYGHLIRECLLNREACRAIQHCVLEAEPGKLDIKRRRQWYSIYQFTSWFTLQTSDYDLIIDVRDDLMSLMMPLKGASS